MSCQCDCPKIIRIEKKAKVSLLYGTSNTSSVSPSKGPVSLLTLDVTTGQATLVGELVNDKSVSAVAIREDGTGFISFGGSAVFGDGINLQQFDPLTSSLVGPGIGLITDTKAPLVFQALEYVENSLYAAQFNGVDPPALYILDPVAESATKIGDTNVPTISGLAYNQSTGIMYALGHTGQGGISDLYTINLTTGVGTLVGSTSQVLRSLQFADSGGLYAGAVSQDVAPGGLYSIDLGTGASTFIGPSGFPNLSGLSKGPA